MPTVNGTLKFFGPIKDGDKATLTGDWDDEENPKKQWVTWEEAKPLRAAGLVFKSKTEFWDDGKPKWKVDGNPSIAIVKTFNGKGVPPTCKIVINGEAEVDASNTTPSSWEQLERDLHVSFTVAVRVWGKMMEGGVPDDATLQATAATVFIEANKKGLHGRPIEAVQEHKPVGGYEEPPAALKDGEEEDDDLPF